MFPFDDVIVKITKDTVQCRKGLADQSKSINIQGGPSLFTLNISFNVSEVLRTEESNLLMWLIRRFDVNTPGPRPETDKMSS